MDRESVMEKFNATKRPTGAAGNATSTYRKVLPIRDGKHFLEISVSLGKVQGLDMFCIDIREPSRFPDPRRGNPLRG